MAAYGRGSICAHASSTISTTVVTLPVLFLPAAQTGQVGGQLRALSEHIPIVRGQRARAPTCPVCPSLLTASLSLHILSLANTG